MALDYNIGKVIFNIEVIVIYAKCVNIFSVSVRVKEALSSNG